MTENIPMSESVADETAETPGQRCYRSLEEALIDRHIPVENRDFIRRALRSVDVAEYVDRGGCIKVIRRDGGPAIEIHYGYTNGFRSEEEILAAVGDVDRWISRRGRGMWGVSHPENKLRDGSGVGSARQDRREYGVCPTCWQTLPATRVCGNCE